MDLVDADRGAAPLWRQVLDDLEDQLVGGAFGQRFPTDRELVARYGVSRHTIRQAVQHLKARGVIERARGRGSVVTGTHFVQPLGALYSLFQAVAARGIDQRSDVIFQGWQADARAAQRLGRPADEPLFRLERVRHAGGEPLALDTVWLVAELGRGLDDADFRSSALYDHLDRFGGRVPDRGQEVIAPIIPDKDLRDVLCMDRGEAALRIERLGHLGDVAVECRLTFVRGSRFALVSRWPDGATVAPQLDGFG